MNHLDINREVVLHVLRKISVLLWGILLISSIQVLEKAEAAESELTPLPIRNENVFSYYELTPDKTMVFSNSFFDNYQVTQSFDDVPKSAEYYKSIHLLRDLGIINGYGDGTFRPNQAIIRQHAGALIERLYHKDYITLFELRDSMVFKDVSSWRDPANQYMNVLYQTGMLNPDSAGKIYPSKELSRGEMAKILVKAFQLKIPTTNETFSDTKGSEFEPYVKALKHYGITVGYPDGSFKPNKSISRAHYSQFIIRTLSHFGEDFHLVGDAKGLSTLILPQQQSPYSYGETNYIYTSNDGKYTTVDEAENHVVVQTYDENFTLLQTKKVPFELEEFGMFYEGKTYNYIAYGQTNVNEENIEVIRVVKYDKNFNRIDSVSIFGDEIFTVHAFSGMAGQMSEHEDELVIHLSRLRYRSSDGIRHQSQLTLIIDTNSMKVTNDTSLFQENHVSHSFEQSVLHDGNQHVLLDHGDGFPRSIVLHKGDGQTYKNVDVVKIPGSIGANQTGVALGGFTQTDDHYLVLYNEIDHSKATKYTSFEILGIDANIRDIKISLVSKDLQVVNTKTIAHYTNQDDATVSNPHLVQISNKEFIVLWQEFNKPYTKGDLKYVKIDDQGNLLSSIQTKERVPLSNVHPIFKNGQIIWYMILNDKKFMYTLDVSDL